MFFVNKLSNGVSAVECVVDVTSGFMASAMLYTVYVAVFMMASPVIVAFAPFAVYKGIRNVLIARTIRHNPKHQELKKVIWKIGETMK